MRRLISVLAVIAIMTAMLVVMATPAFAKKQTYECHPPSGQILQGLSKKEAKDLQKDHPSTTCYPEG